MGFSIGKSSALNIFPLDCMILNGGSRLPEPRHLLVWPTLQHQQNQYRHLSVKNFNDHIEYFVYLLFAIVSV